MKKTNLMLLVVAAGSVLAACGGNNPASTSIAPSSEESVEIGNSVYAGVVVDYAGNSNLLGVSVLSHLRSDGYAYTPRENDTIYLVPSFAGANELDYMTINGQKYEAKVGTAEDKFSTYSGELSLEGIKYVSYKQPKATVNISVTSKAVAGATLHNVTLNITNNTTPVAYYDTIEGAWASRDGSKIDSYFGTAGTHTIQIIEGAWASYLIQGEGLDSYHDGAHKYTAKIGETKLFGNTLESNINNQMKTTASFKMPANDVTVNITMENAYDEGAVYGLVHGAGYVGYATVQTSTGYSGTKILGAQLSEACLPSHVTIADADLSKYAEADYVNAEVKAKDGTTTTKHYYKTIKFASYTLTGTLSETGAFSYAGADFTEAATDKAWYDAVMADAVVAETSAGNVNLGKNNYSKDYNGYWSKDTYPGGSGWKWNRDLTCGAFVDYGPEKLARATKNEETGHWEFSLTPEEGEGTFDLGMTWNDFNSVKAGSNSYVALLTEAYNASLAK